MQTIGQIMRAIEVMGVAFYAYVIIKCILYYTAWNLTGGNFDEIRKTIYPQKTDAS